MIPAVRNTAPKCIHNHRAASASARFTLIFHPFRNSAENSHTYGTGQENWQKYHLWSFKLCILYREYIDPTLHTTKMALRFFKSFGMFPTVRADDDEELVNPQAVLRVRYMRILSGGDSAGWVLERI